MLIGKNWKNGLKVRTIFVLIESSQILSFVSSPQTTRIDKQSLQHDGSQQ